MSKYDTYQTRVGRAGGGTVQFIGDDGYFDLGDVRAGADGTQFTGRQLQLDLLSRMTRTSITLTSAPMAVSVLSPAYGVFTITASVTYNSASLVLPVASKGARVLLHAQGVQSDLPLLNGGNSIVGIIGTDLSRIDIVNGSANSAYVELACFEDGVWAVVELKNRTGIVEQASA